MKITEEQAKAMCYQDAMKDLFFTSYNFLLFFVFMPFPQLLPSSLVYPLQPLLQFILLCLTRSSQPHYHLIVFMLFSLIFNLL